MNKWFAMTAAVLMCGTSAFAGTPDVQAELDAMKAQLQAQQKLIDAQAQQINGLRQAQGQTWLTEAQAEQVKSLINDVLNDAETRASLAGNGIGAGYDDGFFIRFGDDSFSLKVNLQSQTRFTYSNVDSSGSAFLPTDDDNHGFSQRRTKVTLTGHLVDPSFTYGVQINAANGYDIGISISEDILGPSVGGASLGLNGNVYLEDAWAQWDMGNGWAIKIGQFKVPLLRDEAVDSRHQLAVERMVTTDFMTADRSQGIQVSYTATEGSVP